MSNLQPDTALSSIELTIPSSAEWVRVARLVTMGVANRMGFSYDEIEDLKLAVAEACNNAIMHARILSARSSGGPMVRIIHTVYPERLEIQVIDEGYRRDVRLPDAIPDRLGGTDTADLPEDGLGLLLIRSLMDEVIQEPDTETHTLRLVKHLRRSN